MNRSSGPHQDKVFGSHRLSPRDRRRRYFRLNRLPTLLQSRQTNISNELSRVLLGNTVLPGLALLHELGYAVSTLVSPTSGFPYLPQLYKLIRPGTGNVLCAAFENRFLRLRNSAFLVHCLVIYFISCRDLKPSSNLGKCLPLNDAKNGTRKPQYSRAEVDLWIVYPPFHAAP
jgi:hypothetical protein